MGANGLDAVDEECNRFALRQQGKFIGWPGCWQAEGGYQVLSLTLQPQRGTARHQNRDVPRCGQPLDYDRRRVENVLEVVDNEQHLPGNEVALHGRDEWPSTSLTHLERHGDFRQDEAGITQWCQIDEDDPIAELCRVPACHRERQTRLAYPPGTRQRDEPALDRSQQRRQIRQFPLPP